MEEKISKILEKYTDPLCKQLKEMQKKLKQSERSSKEQVSCLSEYSLEASEQAFSEYLNALAEQLGKSRILLTAIRNRINGEYGYGKSGSRKGFFAAYSDLDELSKQADDLAYCCDEIERIWEKIRQAWEEKTDSTQEPPVHPDAGFRSAPEDIFAPQTLYALEALLRDYLGACREIKEYSAALNQYVMQKEEGWTCPSCGSHCSPDVLFCGECGTRRPEVLKEPEEGWTCPRCGSHCSPDVLFCGECGTGLPKASKEPEEEWICPNCGSHRSKDALFCGRCGTRRPEAKKSREKFCPKCGSQVSEKGRLCTSCGTELTETSTDMYQSARKSGSAGMYAQRIPGSAGSPNGKNEFEGMPYSVGVGDMAQYKRLPGAGGPRIKSHGPGILSSLKKVFSRDKKETSVKISEKKNTKKNPGKPGTEKEKVPQDLSGEKNKTGQGQQSEARNFPNVATDDVQFKAAAPARIEADSSFELKLYMYRQEEKALVAELLQEFDTPAATATSGIFEVSRQQELKVVVQSEDVEIKESTASMLWNGRLSLCSFLLYLPKTFAKKQAVIQARVYSGIMALADLRLILKVKANEPQNLDVPVELRRIRSAFASYSSEDRVQVVARLQGMQAVNPELDLFFDRESLRTGEHWEERLFREIETRDVLYLFWSRNAAMSEWVNKEWRHALETGGESAVEPVPLEPPDVCPPPAELRGLHFDNWALRYTQAYF